MSIWSGVGLAATLMHATSSISNSASSHESKHNNTWHTDSGRFIETQNGYRAPTRSENAYMTREVHLLVRLSCRHLPYLSGELGIRHVHPMIG